MSVFGIGGWELILILVIMLVVAGPKRMVQWAYVMGQWTAKLRGLWEETVALVQRELDDAGMDIELPKTPPTRANLNQSAKRFGEQLLERAGNPQEEINNELARIQQDMKKSAVDPKTYMQQKANEKTDGDSESSPTDNATDAEASSDNSFGTWGGA